ncbi:MAG TPA: hypothetical protein VJK29_14680 [Terriglobales bacterium]|nr:hypothetical protein [Terriglobales bacterium]
MSEPEPNSRPARSSRLGPWIVLAMLAMVALPATITLNTVRSPAQLQISPNTTPYGYTWSLLLFIVPIVVIAFWLVPHEQVKVPKQAFRWTIGFWYPWVAASTSFSPTASLSSLIPVRP